MSQSACRYPECVREDQCIYEGCEAVDQGSSFRVVIREAQPHERREIEARSATGANLGSDHCVAVWLDARLVGWGDDYGTFHPLPAPTSGGHLEEAGEKLLAAAVDFWEAEG
jgi:hypothetical protein